MAIASYMIIVILLFYGGILWLQFFLSRKPNRWLGLSFPWSLSCFPSRPFWELPPTRPCAPQLPQLWKTEPPIQRRMWSSLLRKKTQDSLSQLLSPYLLNTIYHLWFCSESTQAAAAEERKIWNWKNEYSKTWNNRTARHYMQKPGIAGPALSL